MKYALLRTLAQGRRLGVAWYLHPNEGPVGDGRHIAYLKQSNEWRSLDETLYDALGKMISTGDRSVAAVERSSLLHEATFADERLLVAKESPSQRERWRQEWFEGVLKKLDDCNLVFADPDNGLCPDIRFNPRQKKSAKSISLHEVSVLSNGRPLIVYHHNTRRKGGHREEIRHWQGQLPGDVHAFYWRRWSNRTFFVVNADAELIDRLRIFADRWATTRAELISP